MVFVLYKRTTDDSIRPNKYSSLCQKIGLTRSLQRPGAGAQQDVDAAVGQDIGVLVGYREGGVVLQPGEHRRQAGAVQVVGLLQLQRHVAVGGGAVHEDGMAAGVRLQGQPDARQLVHTLEIKRKWAGIVEVKQRWSKTHHTSCELEKMFYNNCTACRVVSVINDRL